MRFVLIENNKQFPNDGKTCWYWDTERPQKKGQPYIAVQCYCSKDPNQFVRVKNMQLLFTDQAEYYIVCQDCYTIYRHMQWSGSTRNPGWQEQSRRELLFHEKIKGWCEFCDPVFGNGGWMPD